MTEDKRNYQFTNRYEAHLMRWKRLFAAILGAGLTAFIVFCWPVRPLWMWLDSTKGTIQNYSPDGQWLYTVHIPGPGQSPYLCQLNAASGARVKRIELEGLVCTGKPSTDTEFDIRLSQDASTVFVGTQSPGAGSTDSWHLYDAETGKRRSEIIKEVAHLNPEADSKNGHWFWTSHGIRGRSKLNEGLDIYSLETGKRIIELRPIGKQKPTSIKLHPQRDVALVLWSGGTDPAYYQLLELPSGKELKRFTLPILPKDNYWQGSHCWEGDDLWVVYMDFSDEKNKGMGNATIPIRCRRFDLKQEPLGEGMDDPLLQGSIRPHGKQTYWGSGENWVAYFRDDEPGQGISGIPWITACREWVEKKLNIAKPQFSFLKWVRIVKRPSGEEQYAMPFPVGYPPVVSFDGQWLACGTTEGGVAVFDLNPLPRWPFVLLAGAGTGGLILLLGRRRKALATHAPPHHNAFDAASDAQKEPAAHQRRG